MPTFEELVAAAKALQMPSRPAGPFVGYARPTPLPPSPLLEFAARMSAEALGSVLSTVPGFLDLMTLKQIPGLSETTEKIHETPRKLLGLPDEPETTGGTIGDIIGSVIGMVGPGLAGARMGRAFISKFDTLKRLAVTNPLVVRSIQTAFESIGAESASARPSWTGVIGFGIIDLGIRSNVTSRIMDRIFKEWRSPKLPIWDINRMHWMRERDVREVYPDIDTIYKALTSVANRVSLPPTVIADMMARPEITRLWEAVIDPRKVTFTDAVRSTTLIFDNGVIRELRSNETVFDITKMLLDGRKIVSVYSPRKTHQQYVESLIAQSPTEFKAAIKLTIQNAIDAGDDITKFYAERFAGEPDILKIVQKPVDKNYAVVRLFSDSDPKKLHAVPIVKSSMQRLGKLVRGGRATVVDFIVHDPTFSKVDGIQGLMKAIYGRSAPDAFEWQVPGAVTRYMSDIQHPIVSIIYKRPTVVNLGGSDRVVQEYVSASIPLTSDGISDFRKIVSEHPEVEVYEVIVRQNATPSEVYRAHSDVRVVLEDVGRPAQPRDEVVPDDVIVEAVTHPEPPVAAVVEESAPKTGGEELIDAVNASIQAQVERPTLPAELRKATPSMRSPKGRVRIYFRDDADYASYIVTFAKNSDKSEKLSKWLSESANIDPNSAISRATKLRDAIKDGLSKESADRVSSIVVERTGSDDILVTVVTRDKGAVAKKVSDARYPTPLTPEEQSTLRSMFSGTPETNATFVSKFLDKIKNTFGISETIASGSVKGKFLKDLEEGLRAGNVTPLNYVLSSVLVRNLPDQLFNATKLSLKFAGKDELVGSIGQLVYDAEANLSHILLAPGATYEVLAHELAEQALRLLKDEHAVKLANLLVKNPDPMIALEVENISATISSLTGKTDPIDVAAAVVGEYMIKRYLRNTVPESVSAAVERSTVWGTFKSLMRSIWASVRAVLRIRDDPTTSVHNLLDDIFKTADEGGFLSDTARLTTLDDRWRALLADIAVPRTVSNAGKVVARALTTDIKNALVKEYGNAIAKLVRRSNHGSILVAVEAGEDGPKKAVNIQKRVVVTASRLAGIDPKSVSIKTGMNDEEYAKVLALYGSDVVPNRKYIKEAYSAVATVGDKTIPTGIVFYRVKHHNNVTLSTFFTEDYFAHIIGFAKPSDVVIDEKAWTAFIGKAKSALEAKFRSELSEKVQKDYKRLISGIRDRLVYNLGLTPYDVSQLRIVPSADPRYTFMLDGPAISKVAKRLDELGWTLDDLLTGFREFRDDGTTSLHVGRWTRTTFGPVESRTQRRAVSKDRYVRVDLSEDVPQWKAIVKFESGTEIAVDLRSELKFTKIGTKGDRVVSIQARDPETISTIVGKVNLGSDTPIVIVSDKTHKGVTWYLRRDGFPLNKDLDEIVVTDNIITTQPGPDEKMALHKFESRRLHMALAAGYKIQTVYGNFDDMTTNEVITAINRGLTNTPMLNTSNMVFDPAGLRYLIEMADSRGFHLITDISNSRIRLIHHETGEAYFVNDGKSAVEFLLKHRRVDDRIVDQAAEEELLTLASEIRLKNNVVEPPPNYNEDMPEMGLFERFVVTGTNVIDKLSQWASVMLAPTRDAAPALERLSNGKYPMFTYYQRAKEAHHNHIKSAYDGYKNIVGDTLEGMTYEELQQINMALAYYVGAPESVLARDATAAAYRAEFLRTNKLSERQMAAVQRIADKFTEEFERMRVILEAEGKEVPTHIFGYARRSLEGQPLPFDDILAQKGLHKPPIPGHMKEREIPGIVPSKHVLPVDVMVARYVYAARYYEIVRPLVTELNDRLEEAYSIVGKTRIDAMAIHWYKHLISQLSGMYGMSPNTLTAAITDVTQTALGKEITADKIINDVITYAYGTSLGGRLSAAVRNRTHPILLLFPFAGKEHTMRGMKMAHEYLRNPSGDLAKYIDATFSTWSREAIEQTKELFTTLRGQKDSLAARYAEVMLTLMQKTETRNKAESFFTGVSIAENVLSRLRAGESVASVIESTPLQAMDEPVRAYLLKHASAALEDASNVPNFYKRFGEAVVAHTAWLYGPMEMPGWTRGKLARLGLMYMTWPLNYVHYVIRGMRSLYRDGRFTTYGKDFMKRFMGINAAGYAIFTALGINNDNMFFLGPAEYTGGPFIELAADAYDAARIHGDMRRPAFARFKTQLLRTLIPAGSGIHEIIRIAKSTDAALRGEAPPHEPFIWMLGTPQRIVEERQR